MPEEVRIKHRDLNWLSFNERVLQEAEDKNNPLYERIKFLAIFSSNLDEYFRVRVSQLRQIKRVEKSIRKKLALKPTKLVKEILAKIKVQQQRFGDIYRNQIIPELEENGIFLINKEEFTKDHIAFAEDFFKRIAEHVQPSTIDLDEGKNLFLENNAIYFLVTFRNENKLGLLNIPVEQSGRFIEFGLNKQKHEISFLDDIIKTQIPRLFPEYEVDGVYEIKLSRDAELYIDDEIDGVLAEKIYESLKQRTDGQPTRLLYDATMPEDVQKTLRELLDIGKIDMMPGGQYHNFNDFFSFPDPTSNPSLHAEKMLPIKHKVLENAKNYFEEITKKDISLHFPYMSFSYIDRFLRQAATDEQVEDIKISIYRTAEESELTSALLTALGRGKKVTVFIEAKARFDEKNNIDWGRKFEEAGARVIYSFPKIKVHSKILMVNRRENGELKKYAYIGTGNFNSKTSEIYCDHGIFTAHDKLADELSRVFSVLEGEMIIPREKHLLISPFSTRKAFSDMITRETENAQKGIKAAITAKMNSLEDPELVELLYRASNAGVKIRLLVRGFTCLIPGVKGMSENIYMTSILDQYLEHGRIYIFENGGEEQMYFGSADFMTRNMDRRIEVLAPVYDPDIMEEFWDILEIQLKDNVKARIQDAEETNTYVTRAAGEKPIRSQVEIYHYLKQKHES